MRLPIDTSSLTFIAGSDPATVLDMERRPRADRATGEVLWRLDVVVLGGEDGAEVWSVRVVGEPTGIGMGQALRVVGLSASPWEMEGRHGISFRARSVQAAGPGSASASASAKSAAA
jgi:hypothetical protein